MSYLTLGQLKTLLNLEIVIFKKLLDVMDKDERIKLIKNMNNNILQKYLEDSL